MTAADAPPLIALRGLSKAFGSVLAVHPIDLEVAAGDFCAILGPSGCGKSTLLRMVAGFAIPTSGRVEIAGRDVTKLGPEARPTNMVFQGYGLFPHLNAGENVGFGLALRNLPAAEIAARVAEALSLVRLDGFQDRGIDRLSGGQQQRVALARALIMRPRVLLLDEPLAALDLKLRQLMQEELRRIHREIGGTFVFVTHDQTEAFALANRIVVMNAGRLEQVGTPQDVYAAPRSLFVADFVGESNILSGYRAAGTVTLTAGAAFAAPGADGPVRVLVRPEAVRRDAPIALEAHVADLVFLGSGLKVVATLNSGEVICAREPAGGNTGDWIVGAPVRLGWSAPDHRVFEGGP